MDTFHKPVMVDEVIDNLQVKKGGKYIDATLGGGGHGFEILKKGGILLGLDQDQDAIEYTSRRWKVEAGRLRIRKENLKLVRGNFADIATIARENGFKTVDGVLFDLGMSSYQIEQSGRGFSFKKSESLDMRMGKVGSLTASEIINKWEEKELYELFSRMGEEPNSWALAHSIVGARRVKPIETTLDLVSIIEDTVGKHEKVHPATRIFQALRIAVNWELENFKKGLEDAFEILENRGRIVVISYHSLEDRIAKLYFLKLEREGKAHIVTRKPIRPSSREVRTNRRARSARLRVIARLDFA